ncbi:MAG: cation diffusion facilitator family transporter, partial [Candidatus Omnitrophota bacterium]
VGAGIFRAGIDRIWDAYNGYTIPAPKWIAFYAAIVSILTKESLYHYTNIVGKKINSQAIIANAWHHRSDALSSVGALLGIGGAIFLGEQWYILDPIAAVVVSFFIVKTAVVISFNAFNELTEASLSDETEHKILDIIRGVSGISSPHNLRTRRIGNYIAIDVHVRVDKRMNITEAHDISVKVEDRIKEEFGEGTFILVHVEPEH